MEKFIQKIESEKPVRYTVEDLKKFTENHKTRLGAGGFGEVYMGKFPNGVRIAVKFFKKRVDKRDEEQFMAEVGTIGRTYHINLVRLFGFCHDRNMSALVYEYMAKGSLDKYLFRESKAKAIKWEKLHEIAVGTAKGLAYLHEECQKRIIHYDIKPENILLDENFIPKVGDFGLAKLCNRESTHVTLAEKLWGTRGYSAPEIYYKNHPVTYKCDVYSFGMVLFEIISRRRNTIVHSSRDSIDFFPQRVWEEYEKGKLGSMALACGIERRQQEKVERMCMVALWCVQDLPEARPQMSDVVKILEGGMEILPPAEKPFQYLFPAARTAVLNPIPESSSDGGTREESQPRRYKERTTPIMAKYEIEMATSQQ
ncbi:rust resistance kinase Lr10-like [Mangifera indica]|uniref:rust resistance kinase Lr10-like n=1 Tax=Mangifera indica TaxID=29780 RepID=UPI001CF9BF89|nr:rust resistance kinase Lr10-like [Mangifera indica]